MWGWWKRNLKRVVSEKTLVPHHQLLSGSVIEEMKNANHISRVVFIWFFWTSRQRERAWKVYYGTNCSWARYYLTAAGSLLVLDCARRSKLYDVNTTLDSFYQCSRSVNFLVHLSGSLNYGYESYSEFQDAKNRVFFPSLFCLLFTAGSFG